MGIDLNKYAIAHLNKIKQDISWVPKSNTEFTKEDYIKVKNNKQDYEDYFLGHVGYNLSFGGKWFGGWCSNKENKDYVAAGFRHAEKQAKLIKDVKFINAEYFKIKLPQNSIIYCDPPYKDTLKYKDSVNFDYNKFYAWCLYMQRNNHRVFISEYNMPEKYFKCVWEKQVKMKMDAASNIKTRVEKLFIPII